MRDVLNKKAFLAFKQRCQSAGVHEVYVSRRDTGRDIRFHMNAREPRSKRLLTNEWVIARGPEAGAKEAELRAMLKGAFVVYERGHEAEGEGGAAGEGGAGAGAAAPAGGAPPAKPSKAKQG